MKTLILTHGDVGQLVCGAMRVDTVQVRPIAIHPTEDQRCTDVALIPKQHKNNTFELQLHYERSLTKVAHEYKDWKIDEQLINKFIELDHQDVLPELLIKTKKSRQFSPATFSDCCVYI